MTTSLSARVAGAALVVVLLTGCGSKQAGSRSGSATGTQTKPSTSATASSRSGPTGTPTPTPAQTPGVLSADATSAATGDIPDNQAFLVYNNRAVGFSIKYPEGWTRQSRAGQTTFTDKNNLVRISINRVGAPTPRSVAAGLAVLKRSSPSLAVTTPRTIRLNGRRLVKAVYRTRSAPNSVTGRRVTLIVDRYVLARGKRVATIDLGTPVGVDNVDAYRMMIESFTWLPARR